MKALLENGSADREANTSLNGLPSEEEGFENFQDGRRPREWEMPGKPEGKTLKASVGDELERLQRERS